jgi:sporulation protein YlmC with PRC-barrel domain
MNATYQTTHPSRENNMKKFTTTCVAAVTMLALASPLYAADEKKLTTDTHQQASAIQSQSARDLKGFEVFSQTGEKLGKITDVRIDKQSGAVQFVTLTKGGIFGIGGEDIAVPLKALDLDRESERATLTVSESMLDNAPMQANKSDQEFQRELSSHYGIAPSWGETPNRGEAQMDRSRIPVPDPAPGIETGSPKMRDSSKQLDK